jgi:hypothetical protein
LTSLSCFSVKRCVVFLSPHLFFWIPRSLLTFGFPLQLVYDVIKLLFPSLSQAFLRPFIRGVISLSAVPSCFPIYYRFWIKFIHRLPTFYISCRIGHKEGPRHRACHNGRISFPSVYLPRLRPRFRSARFTSDEDRVAFHMSLVNGVNTIFSKKKRVFREWGYVQNPTYNSRQSDRNPDPFPATRFPPCESEPLMRWGFYPGEP